MEKPVKNQPHRQRKTSKPIAASDSGRPVADMRTAVLAMLLLASGTSALCYEIVWSRILGLLLGHTIYASSIVLVGYFLGMASGYWLAARFAPRNMSDLTMYGLLEVFIGVWALCVPLFVQFAVSSTREFQLLTDSLVGLLILLPATCCLGATLPVLANLFEEQAATRFKSVSLIYAANTIGGLLGIFLATFVLIALLGVSATNSFAAFLSCTCGGLAILLGQSSFKRPLRSNSAPAQNDLSAASITVALVSGLVTLLLQVAYTRMFALVFHNSTYTFALVVAVFLVGLAIGAFVTARFAERQYFLVAVCTSSAVLVAISPMLFAALTQLQYFRVGDSLFEHVGYATCLVSAIVLLPVATLGTLLPSAWRLALVGGNAGTRQTVGKLTALNSLAAAGGACLATFILLPSVGLGGSFVVATAVLCGLVLYLWKGWGSVCFAATCVAMSFFAGQMPYSSAIPGGAELVKRWESGYGWIEVLERKFDGVQLLRQDVQYGLGADLDIDWERRQGALPLMLHPKPQYVAFLGVGTGISVSAIVGDPEIEHVDAVELIPSVAEALPFFSDANLKFYDDPRCKVHATDARHFMRTNGESYDVIVADLFTPWHSRTGYLYTVEHFRNCRQSLRPGGIFCQWLPLWQLGHSDFEIIADSFRSVFPRCTLWWGLCEGEKPLLCLIGCETPLKISSAMWETRTLQPDDSQEVDPFLTNTSRLSHLFLGGWPKRYNCRLNTDDHPLVEFSCPGSDLGNAKLRGKPVVDYFVEVLSRLPQDGVLFAADAQPVSIVARLRWQHKQLSTLVKRGQSRPAPPRFLDQEGG